MMLPMLTARLFALLASTAFLSAEIAVVQAQGRERAWRILSVHELAVRPPLPGARPRALVAARHELRL